MVWLMPRLRTFKFASSKYRGRVLSEECVEATVLQAAPLERKLSPRFPANSGPAPKGCPMQSTACPDPQGCYSHSPPCLRDRHPQGHSLWGETGL